MIDDHQPKKRLRPQKTRVEGLIINHAVKDMLEQIPGNSKQNVQIRKKLRLQNFDIKNAPCYKTLWVFFKNDVTKHKLLELAKKLANDLRIYLDRDAQRDRNILYKWFDEFWYQISPVLNQYIVPNEEYVEALSFEPTNKSSTEVTNTSSIEPNNTSPIEHANSASIEQNTSYIEHTNISSIEPNFAYPFNRTFSSITTYENVLTYNPFEYATFNCR